MALQTLACFGYASMIFLSPFASLFLIGGLLFSRFYLFTPLYAAWYVFDRNTPSRGGRTFEFMRRLPFWRWLAGYFPIRLHKTHNLDPSKNYLFCFHPHGILVHGGICNFLSDVTGFDRLFPGIKLHFAVIDGHFHMPLHREIIMALGLTSPSAQSIEYKLTRMGSGHSVLLVVGGAKEMPFSSMNEYKLYINNRKGFIRVALRTGAPVVPVFSFGESKLFHLDPFNAETSAFYRFLCRLLGANAPKFVLRGNPIFPYLIPLRQKVNTVVGPPITFEPIAENLSEAEREAYVDTCHKMYLDALRKLYDEHKDKFGDARTPLIFC